MGTPLLPPSPSSTAVPEGMMVFCVERIASNFDNLNVCLRVKPGNERSAEENADRKYCILRRVPPSD